jgi:hypothetical protein
MYDIEKVSACLLKISNDPKYLDPKTIKDSEPFQIAQGLYLDLKAMEILENAINEVNNDEYISENVTSKILEDKMLLIVRNAFDVSEKERSKYIKEKLTELKSEIKKSKSNWSFHVPIYNLSIENPFSIGDVKFYTFDKDKALEFRNYVKNLEFEIENSQDIEKSIDNECDYFIKKNVGFTIAEIKLKGLFQSSYQTALQKIRMSINILKLYAHSSFHVFGIQGEVDKPSQRITLGYSQNENSEKMYFRNWMRFGPPYKQKITDENIERMKENGLDELDRILKTKPTKFEKRILTAIYWFGESMNIKIPKEDKFIFRRQNKDDGNLEYFNLGDKFLKLSNALETILVFNENEPIAHTISERCAFFLNYVYVDETKLEIKKVVKNLYDVRSKIVHQGDTFVSKIDLITMIELVRDLILKTLEVKIERGFKTPDEFRDYLEELKFN